MNDNNGAIIMVDFENVGLGGLEGYELLTPNDTLYLFVSDKAKSIKKYIAEGITRTGVNIVYRKLVNEGKNGLDFYITSEIGYLRGIGEKRNISIISKDKGYTAVVDYWKLRTNSRVYISNTIEAGLKASISNTTSRFEELSDLSALVDIPNAFNFRGNIGAAINIDKVLEVDSQASQVPDNDLVEKIVNEIETTNEVSVSVEPLKSREDIVNEFLINCKDIKYSTPEMLKEALLKASGMCNLHNILVKSTTNSRGQKIYSELKSMNVDKIFE